MTEPTTNTLEWEAPAPKSPKKSMFSKFTHTTYTNTKESSPSPPSERSREQEEATTTTTYKRTLSERFLPLWVRRHKIISIAAGVLLLVIILGVGLGVGLSHKNKSSQNLPLPTSKGIFTGDLTYYSPGPGYGACGYENTSSDSICAVAHSLWDSQSTSSNPNENPLCGRKIRITRFKEGVGNRSVDVEVVDRCTGCEPTDLDLSIKMFTTLADEGQGRVVGSWAWL